jgi:hypothetical protein
MTSIWAIADTHLSFGKPKNLARFGERWIDHPNRLGEAWRARIQPDDVVLIPGDVSWADKPAKALPDLEWLAALPGQKVLLRGNHDHWWRSIDEVRKVIAPFGFYALEGDSITLGGAVICGAMGYISPNDPYFETDSRQDRFPRELARLEAALIDGAARRVDGQPFIVLLHYPPFTSDAQPTVFVDMLARYQPTLCLYGHLHRSHEWDVVVNGVFRGTHYRLIASDYLNMTPICVVDNDNRLVEPEVTVTAAVNEIYPLLTVNEATENTHGTGILSSSE